ncbi:restriction endonuclease subunit S [Christiangramia aquimixticola]|uniref:restriction endonuclease subunit S n=1 Tax=Christiangramia aquimixticola TaxID=1697558 RepID=UPI003AA998ED
MKNRIFEKNLREVSGFKSFPDTWREVSINQIFNLGRGRVISQEEIQSNRGVFPVYSSQTSNNGIMGYIDSYDFHTELITWTTDGANAGTVFKREGKFNCTNVCGTLIPKSSDKTDLTFFKYHLGRISKNYVSYIGNPKLMNDVMGKIALPIPDINHQRKIAKILNTADAVIEKTEEAIAKYRAIKQGMMQDLFTRGIDLNTGQLRTAYKDAPHLYKETELGWIPKEWEVSKLQKVTTKVADRDHFTPIYFDDGVPIISPKDFDENEMITFDKCKFISSKAHLKNRKKTNLEVGDLVFTRIGAGLGKVCAVVSWMPEFSILHSACMIKVDEKKMISGYLEEYIRSNTLQRQIKVEVQSIGVPDLGLDKINSFKVLNPSLDEQRMISMRLEEIRKIIQQEYKILQKYQSLKKGLMQDLLTGRVEVEVLKNRK